jgi:tRNA 2-thiouridine synthesizing protein C
VNRNKKIAIVNASSPFGSSNAKEALDLTLIFGSFEQDTSLFFQGDGVWQLVDQQKPELITMKNFLKTLAALEFYDIENVYVCQTSLTERNLQPNFHLENVAILSNDEFSEKLHQHDAIFRF